MSVTVTLERVLNDSEQLLCNSDRSQILGVSLSRGADTAIYVRVCCANKEDPPLTAVGSKPNVEPLRLARHLL